MGLDLSGNDSSETTYDEGELFKLSLTAFCVKYCTRIVVSTDRNNDYDYTSHCCQTHSHAIAVSSPCFPLLSRFDYTTFSRRLFVAIMKLLLLLMLLLLLLVLQLLGYYTRLTASFPGQPG